MKAFLLITVAILGQVVNASAQEKQYTRQVNEVIENYFEYCQQGKFSATASLLHPFLVEAILDDENNDLDSILQAMEKRTIDMISRREMKLEYIFTPQPTYDFQERDNRILAVARAISKYEKGARRCVIAFSVVVISDDNGANWQIIDTIDHDSQPVQKALSALRDLGFELEYFQSRPNCNYN